MYIYNKQKTEMWLIDIELETTLSKVQINWMYKCRQLKATVWPSIMRTILTI